jgi:hypothetical protein
MVSLDHLCQFAHGQRLSIVKDSQFVYRVFQDMHERGKR